MTTSPMLNRSLREWYDAECARIRSEFDQHHRGTDAVAQRSALVDALATRLWQEVISSDPRGPEGLALVAIGGFGRSQLFPHSDVDVLFLHGNGGSEQQLKDKIRQFSQAVWDLHLRFSPATRTLSECDRFDPQNVEFAVSLLDCRYLAGDRALFDALHDKVLPRLVMREYQGLVENLSQITRDRHGKFGDTVFHLEPNVKDTPGCLRDANVVNWLTLVAAVDKLRAWPDRQLLLAPAARAQFDAAVEFLFSVRAFLHYRHGRDDNTLAWEAQSEAALQGIGADDSGARTTAEWMRVYFRHARTVYRLASQLIEEVPASRSSLYRQFQQWRSRVSNADFSVVNGLVFLQQSTSVQDPDVLLRAFQFVAHHGLKLSTTTERRIEQVLPSLAATPLQGAGLWQRLCEIVYEPHAADALRAMHHLGLLTILLPELRAIDALVVRDFYHRFTVDEHSFIAIESLHRLQQSPPEWEARFAALLNEIEKPELLFFALLLHDVGKGAATDDHVQSSLQIAAPCLARLDVELSDRETILFLIERHLDISATLRRDIFEPETIRNFAEKVGTPERLKMLCLLTYADIKAVNPDALTPWKADSIWQLYISTSNDLNRSVDERRLHGDADAESVARIRSLAPTLGRRLKQFLDGMPQRYVASYSATEIGNHVEMASNLRAEPVQLELKRGRHWFELTVVTADRPFLFSGVSGVLTAWGMNIVKANAFSNSAGVIVDTFFFIDRFRTLELNMPEWDRFKRSVVDVLTGDVDVDRMIRDRARHAGAAAAKVKIETRVDFDDGASTHSTLLQVIVQDQPGLLHRISSRIAHHKCNIEIALIDTEGQMAIDVFFLTQNGAKLTRAAQERLRKSLLEELS